MRAALSRHSAKLAGALSAPSRRAIPSSAGPRPRGSRFRRALDFAPALSDPLLAALHPSDTAQLRKRLHAQRPSGVILGGLAACRRGPQGADWKLSWCFGFVPALSCGSSILRAPFPKTAQVARGASFPARNLAIANPLFLVCVACTAADAATELGTSSWLDAVPRRNASFRGSLLSPTERDS